MGTDENGMGSTVGDYDLDGRLDWFVGSIYMSPEQMEPFREVYLGGGFIFGNTGNRLYRFVVVPTNHNSHKQSNEPITTQGQNRKGRQLRVKAGECVNCDWLIKWGANSLVNPFTE